MENLFCFCSNPDVVQYIPDTPRTYVETREELEWFLHGHPEYTELGLWATIYRDTGQFIGCCGLLAWTIDGQHEVEVAFALSEAYWGKGLATEAAQNLVRYGFDHLDLSRLVCLIDHENKASIHLANTIGMTFEREARDEVGPFLLYAMNK